MVLIAYNKFVMAVKEGLLMQIKAIDTVVNDPHVTQEMRELAREFQDNIEAAIHDCCFDFHSRNLIDAARGQLDD
jgi:hypothetical protein